MKRFALLVCLLLILTALGCSQPAPSVPVPAASPKAVEAPVSGLRIGAASATVNPPDGTYLAGYDYNRKSTGVHDNLYAKAVIFDDGKTPVGLVVIDAISLQYPSVQQIRQAASQQLTGVSIPPERIIAQAIHTHCAPDTIGIYGPDETHTGLNPGYMKQLVDTAADVVARAAQNLQAATLAYAETQCVGWAVNDSEPNELDNSVTILECLDAKGKPIATLTNFACHPTVLGGDTTLISADWTGAFYKQMSAALPGQHLFLQGGIGAWVQPKTPERTFALAEQYGNDLAEKTLAALKQAKPMEGTPIRFAHKVFVMPLANETFRQMSLAGLTSRDFAGQGVETEVAWFALGAAQFATHPGETAPMFTRETRTLMKSGPKFVLGLGLDHLGYICPGRFFDNPKAIPSAEYQVNLSPGKDSGPIMMSALKEIIP